MATAKARTGNGCTEAQENRGCCKEASNHRCLAGFIRGFPCLHLETLRFLHSLTNALFGFWLRETRSGGHHLCKIVTIPHCHLTIANRTREYARNLRAAFRRLSVGRSSDW